MSKSANLIGQVGDLPDKLRARDVEFRLRGHIAPEVVRVIAELAERNFQTDKNLMEMATLLDKVIDNHVGILKVADNMKNEINRMRSNLDDKEQLPDVTAQ